MKTIVIPTGLRIVSAVRSPYDKQPTLPKERELLIPRPVMCDDDDVVDPQDLFDNGMTAYMLGHSDMPSLRDVELGYVTEEQWCIANGHNWLEDELPWMLRPQAGEPRSWQIPGSVDQLLNLYRQFGILDFDVGRPLLCLPKPQEGL